MKACRNKVGRFALSLLALAASQAMYAADEPQLMDELVVSGTREAERKSEIPATVDVIKGDAIRDAKASHPSQIMGRVPGVWVNITGGEGHQTAIRQPLTTSPVYAYLEDGIPVRSTGFFNHNALYEVNMPQAGGIEITKGPGTALYGSDAIGGVINVLTRPAPLSHEVEASVEAGRFGWKRLLVTGGNTFGGNGLRADLNLTKTDGWRQATGYDRNSGTLRWDRALDNDAMLKTVVTYSDIDQKTAGSSTISQNDYANNPEISYTPISLRKVKAFRLSAAYEKETANSSLSITPYVRDDSMDLLANWSLGYDPTIYNTANRSLGLMAKYRMDFEPYRARLIIGVDMDNSPGTRTENSITTVSTGSGYTRQYISYTTGAKVYDYDVTYQGVSPYVHGEMSPTAQLRLTGGLRFDHMSYDFRNNLPVAAVAAGGKFYGQDANTTTHYTHLSPKLGATYSFSDKLNGFVAYNHAFRAPSEGQLFRPATGSSAALAQNIANGNLALQPIKVDSYEIGVRGKSGAGISYEASLYHMIKRDDILTQKDPVTLAPVSVNGGKTLHRGIEIGLGGEIADALRMDVSYSYAKHTYENWVTSSATFSGKEMASAPRVIANTRLTYSPGFMNGGKLGMEVVSLGRYWLDDPNTQTYNGHDLLNLSASYKINRELECFARINNLTDRRFAESASLSGANQVFSPGLPRTVYAGLQTVWK